MHALILLRATLSPLGCMVVHGSGGGGAGGCCSCRTSIGTYAGAAFCNSYCVRVGGGCGTWPVVAVYIIRAILHMLFMSGVWYSIGACTQHSICMPHFSCMQ